MLWRFHTVAFCVWLALAVPAVNALADSRWDAAAVFAGLSCVVLGAELLVARVVRREHYDG
jgi:hypothetical protein